MEKKTQAIIAGAVLVVIIIGVVIWQAGKRNQPSQEAGGSQPTATSGGAARVDASKTKLPVPAGTTVPDTNSNVSGDVAKPNSIQNIGPNSQNRTFNVKINNNAFSPAEFIGYVNDVVTINFTAVDKDYDVVQPDYGYKLLILKGQTKLLQGQYTTAGKYVFYCQSCGGPSKGPVGYFVAVPK